MPWLSFTKGVEGFKTIVAKLVEKRNQEICSYVPEKTLQNSRKTYLRTFGKNQFKISSSASPHTRFFITITEDLSN